MRYILRLAVISVALSAAAYPARAQVPQWTGIGASVGGGLMQFGGGQGDLIASVVRPQEDTSGAAAGGIYLSLGTRRWAIILPEIDGYTSSRAQPASGTLTLDSTTLKFEPEAQNVTAGAVLGGVQVALVPSGRVWVRGGIGGGAISSSIGTEDRKVSVALSSGSGLALAGAAGVSVWASSSSGSRFYSIDVEVHYLRINGGSLHVSAPSVRVGWRSSP